jgi:hypothetical protein
MIAYKKHRFISPFGIISTNEGGPIQPYRYIIHGLKNLTMAESKEGGIASVVFAIISATFFSKRKGKFFGRTYQSDPIPLTESRGAARTFETDQTQKHFFYCHSQIDDPSDTWMVIELEVKEINTTSNTVINQRMVGWTSIESAVGIKPEKLYSSLQRHSQSSDFTSGNRVEGSNNRQHAI